jgi:hypothetical protein
VQPIPQPTIPHHPEEGRGEGGVAKIAGTSLLNPFIKELSIRWTEKPALVVL